MTETGTSARVTTGRDTAAAEGVPMSTTHTTIPPAEEAARAYPRAVAYGLVALTTVLVTLTGEMRPVAAVVVGVGITVLLAAMRGRRPITGPVAGLTSAVLALAIGGFEAGALFSVGPLVDGGLFAVITAAALVITHRPTTDA